MWRAGRGLLVILLLAGATSCGRKKAQGLRDPASLPQVERAYPTVASSVALDPGILADVRVCYDEALARDGTQGGVLGVVVTGGGGYGDSAAASVESGKVDDPLRGCVTGILVTGHALHLEAGSHGEVTIDLHSESRREAAPPGALACDVAVRRYIARPLRAAGGPVRVVRTRLDGAPVDRFAGDKREREAHVVADVAFQETGFHDDCGTLSALMGD